MAGQIVNISTKQAISEIALKCGDPMFRDFPKNIYAQAVYRAERAIAKRYGIIDRVLTYTNTAGDAEFDIGPLNFAGAQRVTVTKVATDDETFLPVNYTEVAYELVDNPDSLVAVPDYRYHIHYLGNRYVFRYNSPEVDDEINIYYTSGIAGEEDYEYYDANGNANLIPVLPNNYFEETVRRGIIYIAQIGVATFDTIKQKKYAALIRLYTTRDDKEPERGLERERPWAQAKLYTLEFPGD